MHRTYVVVLALLGGLAGCRDNAGAGSGGALKLAGLDVVIDLPGGDVSRSSDTGNDWTSGPPDIQIRADKLTVDVAAVKPSFAATLDAAKAEIQREPRLDGRRKKLPALQFQRFTKEQPLEGGFHLEYEARAMDSTHYGVLIRKTIDGKAYDCGQIHWKPELAADVVKACLSLRKP